MEFQRRKTLNALEERLEYRFHDLALLDTALTHTSYVKGDGRASAHNERLEFWEMQYWNCARANICTCASRIMMKAR